MQIIKQYNKYNSTIEIYAVDSLKVRFLFEIFI